MKKFIYPSVVAIVVWAMIFFGKMGEDNYIIDSIWVSGLIVLLLALLIWTTQEGAFDSIRWGFGKMFDMFRKTPKYDMKYIEYVEMKKEKEKTKVWPSLVVGGVLFLVGVIWWLIIM